jgi:protein-disulfide isomerase
MAISRRDLVVAGVAGAVGVTLAPAPAFALEGDMTIGDPASAVQLVEYASMTCGHCAAFHAHVFPRLKAGYIDNGRIGFTMREFPTNPGPVSFAMFQVARIEADPIIYFERIAVLFHEQQAILGTGTGAGVRDALVTIAARWGLSRDQVVAAMTDQAGSERVAATVNDGVARYNIEATPWFVLNDQSLARGSASYEAISGALNTALGA